MIETHRYSEFTTYLFLQKNDYQKKYFSYILRNIDPLRSKHTYVTNHLPILMSLHANISPEAAAKLAAQKRNSTISAIIIALLVCTLIGVILWIISLTPLFKNNEETVSYSTNANNEQEITKPEMTDQVERKPSAPSSSMARVIASTTPSPTAVPVPEITVTEPSLDFGDGDDFGDGWGSGGNGSGSGTGGGASFFKQNIKADRVCYVIDYSKSMGGKKINMMKKELTESISKLPDGMEYQLIFFAGPAWVAGDQVQLEGKSKATVKSEGKIYKWKSPRGNNWSRTGKKQDVEWIKASKETRAASLKAIRDTELIWGTTWNDPLEMALEMKPTPDYVFFMTDGAPGTGIDGALKTAKRIGAKAKVKDVKVNTISLLLPQAKEALKELADKTGGEFSLITK